ncbi:unnamed protein product [Sympodiomycopsis kandeliae]
MPALFESTHSEQVKKWLIAELGPICDAEPDVLADYVIALLKHDANESDLTELLKEQLSDFLDDNTDGFVKKLVSTLAKQSYLFDEQQSASNATGILPEESNAAARKRPADEEPVTSPPSGPKAQSGGAQGKHKRPRAVENHARSSIDRSLPEAGVGRDAELSSGSIMEPHSSSLVDRMKPMKARHKCRDFHEKGWCARGDHCKYEHSTDAILGGVNMQPAFGHAPPHHGSSFPSPANLHFNGGHLSSLPSAPSSHQEAMASSSQYPPSIWAKPEMNMLPPGHQQRDSWSNGASSSGPLSARIAGIPDTKDRSFGSHLGGSDASRDNHAGRGKPRFGSSGSFQSRARSSTTLVIENVPSDSLDLIKINDYFKRFGTITNIQIDAQLAKALVSYSSSAEAKAAHESPDVIFGNRFVKVYFQRLDEAPPSSGSGASSHAQPTPTPKKSFAQGQNVFRPSDVPNSEASATPSMEQLSERRAALEAQKSAQARLNTLITEQKQLMVRVVSGTGTSDEKKSGMKRLRELEPIIKEVAEETKKAVERLSALPAMPPVSKPLSAYDPIKVQEQKQKAEKERLDRELDAHSRGSAPGSQTEELRAKLQALKAEAAQLGINGSDNDSAKHHIPRAQGWRGGHRGSGVRGGWAGGGAMRLDNRTTRLHVTGIANAEEANGVKEWLKTFGEVASFDDSAVVPGDFSVNFRTRQSGEQALRSDLQVPNVGKVSLRWASSPSAATEDQPAVAASTPTALDESGDGGQPDS